MHNRAWQAVTENIGAEHAALDERIAAWCASYIGAGGRIYCGRGCRNCCTLAVNATFPEAVRLARSITNAQTAAIGPYAERLLATMGNVRDLKEYLRLQRQTLGFCPFLADDGACGVYAVRPSSCRSLISTRESSYCALDFSLLSPAEKEAYLASLDRQVVAFPMHYAAVPRDLAQQLEASIMQRMRDTFGFALYGDLPFLVHLELEYRLSDAVVEGCDAVEELLGDFGLDHPLLVVLDRGDRQG